MVIGGGTGCSDPNTRNPASQAESRRAKQLRSENGAVEALLSRTRYDRVESEGNELEAVTFWRRKRDSNPRNPSGFNGFQDRRIKPLSHSSIPKLPNPQVRSQSGSKASENSQKLGKLDRIRDT